MVGNNSFGKSKPEGEVLEIFPCYSWSINFLCTWDEFGCFGTPLVYDGEDAVMVFGFW
jgi:hypothetical protein